MGSATLVKAENFLRFIVHLIRVCLHRGSEQNRPLTRTAVLS
jgi:hypothetical protein